MEPGRVFVEQGAESFGFGSVSLVIQKAKPVIGPVLGGAVDHLLQQQLKGQVEWSSQPLRHEKIEISLRDLAEDSGHHTGADRQQCVALTDFHNDARQVAI